MTMPAQNKTDTLEVIIDRLIPKLAIDTVEDLHHLLRQRALVNDVHIRSQLCNARRADDDRVTLCMV